MEVETALAAGRPTVPVLVEGAALPNADALPPSLVPLLEAHVAELRDGSWASDVDHLVRTSGLVAPPPPPPPPPRPWRGVAAGVAAAALAVVAVVVLWPHDPDDDGGGASATTSPAAATAGATAASTGAGACCPREPTGTLQPRPSGSQRHQQEQ